MTDERLAMTNGAVIRMALSVSCNMRTWVQVYLSGFIRL